MNLSSSEWQAVAAIALSTLGLIATFYTAFGSTARRLRNDLATDTKLVEELDGDVKEDLEKSVTERAYRLVAATRYPSLTWYEAALGLLLVPLFWLLFSAPGELRTLAKQDAVEPPLVGPGQALTMIFVFVTYAALVHSWSGRAASRIVYVYRRLGDNEARALARLLAFPANLVPMLLFFALSFSVLLNVSEIVKVASRPSWVAVLITTAISMGLIWCIFRIASREDLSRYLRFYTDVMHAGADLPRLRPAELGQTEEDLARYQEASERRFPRRRRTRE